MSEPNVTIVTAASRGMGRAVAETLAERGHRLVLMSTTDAVETLARELGAVGIRGSVTEPADLQRLVELAMTEHGRIDGLVNNTGHAPKGPLLELTDDDWHAGLDLLVLNVVRMARLVTPIMRDQGGGSIVNISTFAAVEPDAAFPVSSALRAALGGFVKMYADAHATAGVRMNSILPGFIDSHPETDANRTRIPMGRYGTVQEVARVAAFLLSDDAGYMTGQSLRVDGGLTRSV